MVPSKGREKYTADRVSTFLEEVGCLYGDVVAKSDQESSVKSLVEAVEKLKGVTGNGKWIVEHSSVGSSQSKWGDRASSAERAGAASSDEIGF
jgi:hypothetical protein